VDISELSSKIIGAAIEVHRVLGPGLLESVYEECLCHELDLQGMFFERQKPLTVAYKGKNLVVYPINGTMFGNDYPQQNKLSKCSLKYSVISVVHH